MTERRLRILLLYVLPPRAAGTIRDHVGAFLRFSRHRIQGLNNLTAVYGSFDGRMPTLPRGLDLDAYDAIVIHYSCYLIGEQHFDLEAREKLRAFGGLKVLFLQDEYRMIDAISEEMQRIGVRLLFTCVPESEIEKVYPAARLPGVRKVPTLTGFVPPGLAQQRVPPLAARPIDVGYRGRLTPFWLGELGAEKWQIVPRFLHATRGSGLRSDISFLEEERIYGRAWLRFITSCRTMLGVESGASVFDFNGELQAATDRYLGAHPGATFEEVQQRFLKDHEGRIRLNQISPRSFEAAALRTAMVLYEGEYSGVLVPERHYVPLRKDFSNIDAVVSAIRDVPRLQAMADRAHSEIALDPRYSYRAFIEQFDAEVERELVGSEHAAQAGSFRRRFSDQGQLQAMSRMAAILLARIMLTLRIHVLPRIVGPIYSSYIHLLPESLRLKLRPFVRRIMFGKAG